MNRRFLIAAAALMASAAPAFAHINADEHGSFATGFAHPLFGLDHVLVMIAVGLWAAQIGGRALWIVPTAFVAMMAVGFALATSGVALPLVEPAILASVVALGLLVAMAVRLDTSASAAIVGLFALFHGHAHGGELGSAGALPFAVGFLIATAALHTAGIGLGVMLGRLSGSGTLTRVLGGITALAGTALIFG